MKLTLTKVENSPPLPESDLVFGRYFTPHMFQMRYYDGAWQSAEIVPFQSLNLSPAAMVFHYGQAIFEGTKAFYCPDGKVRSFRLRDHLDRFNLSARRMCMPEIDTKFVLEVLKKLLDLDRDWIPRKQNTSLYIRPYMIATEPSIHVLPSEEYLFLTILSPVGDFYARGNEALRVYAEDRFIRATPGGTGNVKAAGNYATSFLAAKSAMKLGCKQVLWLDAQYHRYIEEVGAMNIFFTIGDKIITPSLTGSILPGITRESLITIIRSLEIPLEIRPIMIEELLAGIKTGLVKEIFATGTAAGITKISSVFYKGSWYELKEDSWQNVKNLREILSKTQFGLVKEYLHWVEEI